MSTRRVKNVVYLAPGSLFPEDTHRRIDDGPDIVDRALAGAPSDTFAFTIQTLIVADPVPDGEGGELNVIPRKVDESGRYYVGGEVFTAAQVAALGDDFRILRSNMQSNGWDQVIRTPFGNWQPLNDGDTVLPTSAVTP